MKSEIKVPAMGESISEATVGAILKPTGSPVKTGDELLELETDKVNQVLYAQQTGVVSYTVKSGDTVKIGQVIGAVDSEAAAKKEVPPLSEVKETKKTPPPAPAREAVKAPPPPAKTSPPSEGGARMSKAAFVQTVAPKAIPAEEPHPLPSALQRAPAAPAETPERGETRRKMSKIRQVIAKRLVEVKQQTAMLTTFNEVDMSAVIQLRERYKDSFAKEHGVKLGFMSFFVKATVAALQQFPDLNSYIDGEEIVHRNFYDIGIAVSTDRGLVVPVVRHCEHLSFAGIESAIEAYAKKAREGKLTVEDLQGGSFTITNGGIYGSLLSTPILNPPQSGILGMHKILKRPVVVDDQIVIRSMMYLALSYDHRLIDGKEAVSFLVTIKNYLEDPSRMLLEV